MHEISDNDIKNRTLDFSTIQGNQAYKEFYLSRLVEYVPKVLQGRKEILSFLFN
jgi:hypothetical protein